MGNTQRPPYRAQHGPARRECSTYKLYLYLTATPYGSAEHAGLEAFTYNESSCVAHIYRVRIFDGLMVTFVVIRWNCTDFNNGDRPPSFAMITSLVILQEWGEDCF